MVNSPYLFPTGVQAKSYWSLSPSRARSSSTTQLFLEPRDSPGFHQSRGESPFCYVSLFLYSQETLLGKRDGEWDLEFHK